VDVTFVDVGTGGDDARTLEALDAAIVPGTRLVSLSHVAWGTGAVLPIAEIARLAHDRGALLAVDGAQSAGAIPVDVEELGADFYAISAQKWLLGPEGMGALAVSSAAIADARPTFAGWFAFETINGTGDAAFRPDARRFEGTNFHRPSVTGMARSLGWLSMYVGLDWVHERGVALARRAAERLAPIPGVELLTPLDRMATLISFRIAGWPAEEALTELGARVFAIARQIPDRNALRISVAFFTTEAEIERFAGAVELLAAHSPETLPPRRGLTMLGQDA
jgi:L-cysteine/cystine lyase